MVIYPIHVGSGPDTKIKARSVARNIEDALEGSAYLRWHGKLKFNIL
jgi:hypothetical protein